MQCLYSIVNNGINRDQLHSQWSPTFCCRGPVSVYNKKFYNNNIIDTGTGPRPTGWGALLQDNYVITHIIAQCIKRLKTSKSDGNYGLNQTI